MYEAIQLLILSLQCNLLLDTGVASDRAAEMVQRSCGSQVVWRELHRRNAARPKG